MNAPLQVYSAESRVRNFPEVLRAMASGLIRSRYVAYRLARKDIVSQYSKSALGFLWDFAYPLVLGVVFYFLRSGNVFSTGDTGMPYSAYLIFGLLMYQSFVNATMMSVNLLQSSRGLITQQKLPPEALLVSVFFRVGFFSLFRIAVMLFFGIVTGAFSLLGSVGFVAGYPVLILAGMAIGVFLAPFNAIYKDVGRFVGMVLVPLRFISPVLFVLPETPVFQWVNSFNSFSLIMVNLRAAATGVPFDDLGLTAVHCGVLFFVGLVGWFMFHVSVPVLAERA